MENISDIANRIENIEWYVFERNTMVIGKYKVTTIKGLEFDIVDTSEIPLLGDDLESKMWVAENYWMLL